jgi:hypothetical protein
MMIGPKASRTREWQARASGFLLTLVLLVAAALPDGTRNLAPILPQDEILLDAGRTGSAVLPKIERDQRVRGLSSSSSGDDTDAAPAFQRPTGAGEPARPAVTYATYLLPSPHLAQRTASPRAPPLSV